MKVSLSIYRLVSHCECVQPWYFLSKGQTWLLPTSIILHPILLLHPYMNGLTRSCHCSPAAIISYRAELVFREVILNGLLYYSDKSLKCPEKFWNIYKLIAVCQNKKLLLLYYTMQEKEIKYLKRQYQSLSNSQSKVSVGSFGVILKN